MATSSYNRPVTINPDWGVKNLIEGMKKGDQLRDITDEDVRRTYEMLHRELTPEEKAKLRGKI